MIEKRRHKRVNVSMKLVISSLFRQNNINLINFDTPIEIINVSRSGIGFRTENLLPLDYYFNAQLQFGDDENAVLYCIVKIIRASLPPEDSDEKMVTYGCEIVGLSSIHEEIFAKYDEIFNGYEDIEAL